MKGFGLVFLRILAQNFIVDKLYNFYKCLLLSILNKNHTSSLLFLYMKYQLNGAPTNCHFHDLLTSRCLLLLLTARLFPLSPNKDLNP